TAIGLFVLTTEPRSLVVDLERRGLSSRFAFVALSTIEAVPAMVERAQVILEAQRARGLDTEGGVLSRVRGFVPLVAPLIFSSLTEVEERSLALEVRAFGRPGRRELLWEPSDSGGQAVARWLLVIGFLAVLLGRAFRAPFV